MTFVRRKATAGFFRRLASVLQLGSPEGWKKGWAEKVLKPVDAKGNPIKCEGSKCEGDFDRTWTQHTAFKIDEKSKGDIIYVSAFDNGDGRGME